MQEMVNSFTNVQCVVLPVQTFRFLKNMWIYTWRKTAFWKVREKDAVLIILESIDKYLHVVV